MDPMTILDSAASVAQFVDLASELLLGSTGVENSKEQYVGDVLTLDIAYERLQHLSSSLELSSQKDPSLMTAEGTSEAIGAVLAISDLSMSCKTDCDKLSENLCELQARNRTNTQWRCPLHALETILTGDEMSHLIEVLHYTRRTLAGHIRILARYWQSVFQLRFVRLREKILSLFSLPPIKLADLERGIFEIGRRIDAVYSYPELKNFGHRDIKSLQNHIAQLNETEKNLEKESKILRSINFESRPMRYSSLADAHQGTFEWVFAKSHNQDADVAFNNLLLWLQRGDGFFWVSGKPGSGKSTLMKFITDHPQTLQALSMWSHPGPPVIARHSFWSAGTEMQRSWQGLLQTLLFEIFRQRPDLIGLTCTERWLKTTEQLDDEKWHVPELRRVLQRIADCKTLSVKFCFFIDGLDEFEGNHQECCQILHDLSRSAHMKFCVSSRPWNIFEQSFGYSISSKLYMHELTRSDIYSYARSTLQAHQRWKELEFGPHSPDRLFNQVTERANGVFLWVYLVIRQLQNCLDEFHSFSELRDRFDRTPNDLDMLFKQILEAVESYSHSKMATTFKIALAVHQPAHAAIYYFHDEEYRDKDYALTVPLQAFLPGQVTLIQAEVKYRLKNRCRGLLELRDERVEFLHRTVMDYLRTSDVSDYLDRKIPAEFNAHLSLLRAFTAYIKITAFPEFVDRKGFANFAPSNLMSALSEALAHAKQVEDSPTAHKLLDELSYCIPRMHETQQAFLNVWGDNRNPISLFFWEPVINASIFGYLRHILPRLPSHFPQLRCPPESLVIFFILLSTTTTIEVDERSSVLQNLLRTASHPNQTYIDLIGISLPRNTVQSAWSDMIQKVIPTDLATVKPGLLSETSLDTASWELKWTLESGLFVLMLQHGADPNSAIESHQSPSWLNFVLLSFCIPSEMACRTAYLQVLDCFLSNGAAIRAPLSLPGLASSESDDVTGLDLFIKHLLQTQISINQRIDQYLLSGVVVRLISWMGVAGAELLDYLSMIENTFPPNIVLRMKSVLPIAR